MNVILIRFIDLHLEGCARVSGVEKDAFKYGVAEFMDEPGRDPSGLGCRYHSLHVDAP